MIRLLLRRDQGTDNLIIPVLISLVVGFLFRGVGVTESTGPLFDPGNNNSIWFAHVFSGWALLLAGMIGSHFWLRSPRLHMALPLSPRTLWLVRMGAICIGCGSMLFMLALINGVSFETGRGLHAIRSVWLGALRLGSMFLLMLMLLQLPDPRLRRLETTPWYIVYTAILWCFGALILLLGPRSPWLAAPVAVIALLVGLRIWRHLPRAFLLVGTEPEDVFTAPAAVPSTAAPAAEAATAADLPRRFPRSGASRKLLHGTLFRLMHNHWLGWLFITLLAIYGLVLTIHYDQGNDLVLSLVYFFVFAFGSHNQSIVRVHPVDAWPISRRLIFAHAFWPLVIPYALGAGCGVLIEQTKARPSTMVEFRKGQVATPYEFREIAPDGVPPTIGSPWGETHTPRGTPVLPWTDVVVYDPYEIGENSSRRFAALQVDRAVAAVHGDPAPDPSRYVEPTVGDAEEEGAPAVAVEASQAEEDTGRPHVSRAARLAAYGALLATALGLVWQSGYLDRPLGLIPALGGRLSGEWEESRPLMDEEWVPDRGPVESGTAVPEPGTDKGAAPVDAAAAPVARTASEGLVGGPSPSAPAVAMSATELATAPPPAPDPEGLPEPDAAPAPAAPPIVTVSRAFAVRVASYPPGSRWAERSLNRLRQAGERAFFSPVHSRGQVYDRLLVGRFVSWDEAYRYARGLQDEGVVEEFSVQRLPFSLDLGRYPTRVAALEAAAQGEGRYLHVLEVDGGFALRGGAFASIEEGDVLVGRLTGAEPLSADNN